MSVFPALALLNRYYIGDTVLLTGIAEGLAKQYDTQVYIVSNYPELLLNNPYAIPKTFDELNALPHGTRIIDMSESIKSMRNEEIQDNGKTETRYIPIPNKMQRMYDQAGCTQRYKPKLYLSDKEKDQAKQFKQKYGGKLIAIGIGSRHSFKIWEYYDILINQLSRNHNLFIVHDSKEACYKFEQFPVTFLTDLSIRELVINMSVMDLYIGNDTATAHITSALDVQSIVIGYEVWSDLYDEYISTRYLSSTVANLKSVSVSRVISNVKSVLSKPYMRKRKVIGLMLLEGLGGTITLSDTAKKIYQQYDEKPVLVIRKNPELFDKNPYISDVITLGTPRYEEITPTIVQMFERIAVIKTGIGKWYGIKQDFSQWRELYENHPIGINVLEALGLNLIQLANKSLGLPYDTIESEVFRFDEPNIVFPDTYIVISNGVDTWHQGLRQTKSWEDTYWQKLNEMIPIPVIQVGTNYDTELDGVIDLRGKTTIPEMLYILKRATAIICTEGGLMHLGYAVGNPNTFVLRGPTRGNFYGYKSQYQIDANICELCYWDTFDWYKDCPKGINAICMKSITPERVYLKLKEVLSEDLVEDTQFTPVFMDSGLAVSTQSVQESRI